MSIRRLISSHSDVGAQRQHAFDVRDYDAVGDGVADDTTAFQESVQDAIDANGQWRIPEPPSGGNWTITDTIDISSSSGSTYAFIDILANGKNAAIQWEGGSNKPVFRFKNVKQSYYQGIEVNIPSPYHDVVVFSHESDGTYQSSTGIVYRDCTARFASGASSCTGWKAENNGGAGDFASFAFDSCAVFGPAGEDGIDNGHFGWRAHAPNALQWNWMNCIATSSAVGFCNHAQLTLLNGAINDSVTTVTVDVASRLPYAGTVLIGTEKISYTSRNATELLGCTRGAASTTPASHSDNSVVSEVRTGGVSGGTWTHLGTQTDKCEWVFDVANGPLTVYGGRHEEGSRLLHAGWGAEATQQQYLFDGVNVSTFTPADGVVFALATTSHLDIRGGQYIGQDFDANFVKATGVDSFGAAGANGRVTIEGASIQGAAAQTRFWTLPATWTGTSRGLSVVNSSLLVQARTDTARVYNVREYGATGDGSTNDTIAFSNAIAACPVHGTVFVPQGRYRVGNLTVGKTIRFLGEGAFYTAVQAAYGTSSLYNTANYAGGSLIECTATSGSLFDTTSGAYGTTVHLDNIALLGIGDNTRTTIAVKTGTTAPLASSKSSWHNVWIINFAIGAQCRNLYQADWSGIVFHACKQAIDWADACNQNSIRQLTVSSCGAAATPIVLFDECTGNNIRGMTAQTNVDGTVLKLTNASQYNSFSDIYFEDADTDLAIEIDGASDARNKFFQFHLGGVGDGLLCDGARNDFWFGQYSSGTVTINSTGNIWWGDLPPGGLTLGTGNFRVGNTDSVLRFAVNGNWAAATDDFGVIDTGFRLLDGTSDIFSVTRVSGNTYVKGAIEIDGALNHDGTTVGFYGSTPVVKATVTGSRGGNAALADLLTKLASLGVITDGSSA